MCLYLRYNNKTNRYISKPTVAKEDKICYKLLDSRGKGLFQTPFQKMKVRIGQTMKADLGISYASVNEGIHAYTSKRYAIAAESGTIVECIIPKGAKYIVGKYDDIVATEMKLKRIIYKDGKLYKGRK